MPMPGMQPAGLPQQFYDPNSAGVNPWGQQPQGGSEYQYQNGILGQLFAGQPARAQAYMQPQQFPNLGQMKDMLPNPFGQPNAGYQFGEGLKDAEKEAKLPGQAEHQKKA